MCDKYYSVKDAVRQHHLFYESDTGTFLLMRIPLTWPETHFARSYWTSRTNVGNLMNLLLEMF